MIRLNIPCDQRIPVDDILQIATPVTLIPA